jgi:hypothetical protein
MLNSETNRRKRRSIVGKTHDQLRREMGCVSAAAVPAHQQFVSRTQTLIDQICCLSNLRINVDKRLQSLRCGGNRFMELKKMRHGVGARLGMDGR